ncbi:UNVERIFIED_CONTAM: hypothetical protein Sangu_3138900 [Sesamum angustifolium]|uniref:Uncharacterized protein n=1 Tax=Sesamum angustifolium TaxID=2727405 RepID=A0AAW2K0D0_9LAMI
MNCQCTLFYKWDTLQRHTSLQSSNLASQSHPSLKICCLKRNGGCQRIPKWYNQTCRRYNKIIPLSVLFKEVSQFTSFRWPSKRPQKERTAARRSKRTTSNYALINSFSPSPRVVSSPNYPIGYFDPSAYVTLGGGFWFGSNCAPRFENAVLYGGKYGNEVDEWSFMNWRRSGIGEQSERVDLLATDKADSNAKLDLSLHL